MSKASEWAKSNAARPKSVLQDDEKALKIAQIHDDGDLTLYAEDRSAARCAWIVLAPDKAIELARWILDTFGEPDAK